VLTQKKNQRAAFLVALTAFGISFLYLLRPVLMPVILAAILVILLYPAHNYIRKLLKGREYLASFISTLLIFLFFVLPTGLLIALLVSQAVDIFSQVNIQESFAKLFSQESYQKIVQPFVFQLQEKFHLKIDLPALVGNYSREALRYVYGFSPQVLTGTLSFIFNFLVMHISIFFLFIEGKKVAKTFFDLSPLKASYEDRLSQVFQNMIYATIYGYLVTAGVQAVLAWIGFAIAGVKAPMVFATLTFFMAMVPIIGATAVWLPLALWLYFTGDTKWAFFIGIYGGVLISGVDNFIKPIIMKEKAQIHALVIFFALFGGIKWFGPIGILFGPVIASLFFACIKIYQEDFIKTSD